MKKQLDETEPLIEPTIFNESMHSTEIPTLVLKRTKGTPDFLVEEIYFESKSWRHDQALENMQAIIELYKSLNSN